MFDSESGRMNDLKLVFAAYPLSGLKGLSGEQAGKCTCCAFWKGTYRDFPILVW